MELTKFWKYLAIGMIVAVVFGITLNVGWETVFLNLVLGFGTAIGKGMRKDYEMKYAFLNYTILCIEVQNYFQLQTFSFP